MTSPEREPVQATWTLPHRIGFRFAFLFWAIFCTSLSGQSQIFDVIPKLGDWLDGLATAPLASLAETVAQNVLHLPEDVATWHETGSGDTTLHYISYACILAISLVGTLIWSVLDRRRTNYQRLYSWLQVGLRYTVGVAMLSYGFSKVFVLQFPAPGLNRLTETYGNSTPMALLWTFMGASPAYTRMAGLGECLGGLLLMFRRTTTLGALLTGGIMFNVLLLNLCYDVPVKIYSATLTLACLFLLLPDAKALFRFFILRQEATPARETRSTSQTPKWVFPAVQAIVVTWCLYSNGYSMLTNPFLSTNSTNPELYGAWKVDSYSGPEPNWDRVLFESQARIVARTTDDVNIPYRPTYLPASHSVDLEDIRGKPVGSLRWNWLDATRANLTGSLANHPLKATIHLTNPKGFPLLTRGFHWINEKPMNR